MSNVSEAAVEGVPNQEDWISKLQSALVVAYRSPAFWPGVAAALGLTALFWPLFVSLWQLWGSPEGYYSHGYLVPFISGYVISRWWPRLHSIPIKTGWIAGILLVGLYFFIRASLEADFPALYSFGFILALFLGVWFVAGIRWMFSLALPIGYLLFAMPVWDQAINAYTNPLQQLSTKVALTILKLGNFEPMQDPGDPTTIYLNHFTLNVGIPCSGFKLMVAVTAFTVFFVMISNLKWWANLVMFAVIIPLALLINGLRVAMIGMVGDWRGEEAGMKFHDWSGYITLIICFFILFKIARGLGWKD